MTKKTAALYHDYRHQWAALPGWLQTLIAVPCGMMAMVLASKITLPWWPVPLTLGNMMPLLLAAYLRPRDAMGALGLFLGLGCLGVPVNAPMASPLFGLAFLGGTTGGYLVGYFMAAGAVSWLKTRVGQLSLKKSLGLAVLGNLLIWVPGWAWLSTFIGYQQAFMLGIMPFLLGDAVKIALEARALRS